MAIIGSDPRKKYLDQIMGRDQFTNQNAFDSLKQDAAMQSSPAPTFGSPTADMMQQGGADLSQYSGAPTMQQNDQFSAVQPETTAQALDAGGANDFDLGAITSSLSQLGGKDDFKFNKPNMQVMKVGGSGQGYQSMAPQPVQPLSTAMGAISSPQQTMAAAGQPQQDEQVNMMRRMLGLA